MEGTPEVVQVFRSHFVSLLESFQSIPGNATTEYLLELQQVPGLIESTGILVLLC